MVMFVINSIKGLEDHQLVVGIILILAVCAFLLTFIALLITTIAFMIGKKNIVPKYLFLLNIVFFLIQFYYFFISNISSGTN